jgi:NADPH2:quinone reductase
MKAWICNELGKGPEGLVLGDAAPPVPGPREIAIRVGACGINFADGLLLQGKYQVQPRVPFTPGLEVAGTVEALGTGVTAFRPGDRVIAMTGSGGYGEVALAPAARAVPLPAEIGWVEGAAFPIAYGTSHLGLAHRAHLRPGETLLVLGASGGVGLTAVELGKLMGARVIAVANGPEKCAVAARAGADETLDPGAGDVVERLKSLVGPNGVDVVYDPVGGALFDAALKVAAFECRVLLIGFASGDVPQIAANRLLVKNVDVIGFYWGAYGERRPELMAESFRALVGWWQEGRLRPHVSDVVPLDRAPEGLRQVLDRKSTGKVVIEVAR